MLVVFAANISILWIRGDLPGYQSERDQEADEKGSHQFKKLTLGFILRRGL
jgi:hypothetical protein